MQTCEHIVLECQPHEEHWNIIAKEPVATLFGTKAGIDALAEFVKLNKAFIPKTKGPRVPISTTSCKAERSENPMNKSP